ncbi:MAG: 5-formyltetrahydrofolate cyclo-ligase [Gammaproteobacteria bacterium]|nr:5-formyltetrahydrofolate cyclo-ligase [Gammaproteobacteria bacterium]
MNSIEKIEQIRQQMRQWRDQTSVVEQQYAAQQAIGSLITSTLFLKSQHIACYLPVRNELNTNELIEKIWQAGKYCYLPALDPIRQGYMNFRLYKKGDKLIVNQFSIPEPDNRARTIPPWALDLVMTPLLAFDHAGNRLGSGCGYYDRVFADIKRWPHAPLLCGFAYHQQQITQLPIQPWDIPTDFIVTDKALIQAGK